MHKHPTILPIGYMQTIVLYDVMEIYSNICGLVIKFCYLSINNIIFLITLSMSTIILNNTVTRSIWKWVWAGKSCDVRGSTPWCDTKRHSHDATKFGPFSEWPSDFRHLRQGPIFDASCRRPPHITRFSGRGLIGRVVSCRIVWCGGGGGHKDRPLSI